MMTKLKRVVLFFALLPLVWLGCNNPSTQTEEEPPKTEIFSGGVKIDYNVCGNADTTLLFVHGWCINQTYWEHQVEAFCDRYKVVTIDLPGFGNSGNGREEWTIEDYGEDVSAVISLLGLKHVILVGHSMGGDVILEAALKQKDEVIKLVGVDNFKDVGVFFDESTRAEIDAFVNLLKQDFDEVIKGYADTYLFHVSTDSLVKESVINDYVNSNTLAAIGSFESLINYVEKEYEQLGRLEIPLSLINSNATPTLNAGLDSTGVHYRVYDAGTTGHFPMIEAPDKFNELLEIAISSN
ncbi:MAG: alpha/beta hydrolase [Bacteroidota bacterium]